GHPGHRGRPAGRRREQRLDRLDRRPHRGQPARPALHRRLQPQRDGADPRRHPGLRGAGRRPRRGDRPAGAGAHPLAEQEDPGVNTFLLTWEWLTDPANWQGSGGIPAQALEHLRLSFIAVLVAAAVAVPAGLWVGHTGRFRWLAINLAGAFRAIPSLGVLFVAFLLLLPRLRGDLAFELPALIVLVLLAVPPILSGTYAGVEATDAAARDAAR